MDRINADPMKLGIKIYRGRVIPLLDEGRDEGAVDEIDQVVTLLDFSLPYLEGNKLHTYTLHISNTLKTLKQYLQKDKPKLYTQFFYYCP